MEVQAGANKLKIKRLEGLLDASNQNQADLNHLRTLNADLMFKLKDLERYYFLEKNVFFYSSVFVI